MQLTFIGSSMTKRNKSCESEVMLTMQRKELLKKSAIRYAEYYGMVEVQDALYADSASEKIFTNLISIIGSDANIKMAYRNLKSNKGSSTPGVDGKTFKDLAEMSEEALVPLFDLRLRYAILILASEPIILIRSVKIFLFALSAYNASCTSTMP